MADRPEIRYAVVGLGHIAQVAVLPAFAHARRNSRLTALVSDDPRKLKALGRTYQVDQLFSYREYDACLEQVDAVYLALPNSLHAEYTVRAARAGVHVLCEKPMAVTARECRQMIDACARNGVKLMIAYRLHFEEMTLAAIDLIRRGKIGEPKVFNSSFTMRVRPGDVRTQKALGGGSLYDIGVYCINAARALFEAEPIEVLALSVNSGIPALSEVDESTGALLRFEDGRIAVFVTSFNASSVDSYSIVGTKGHLQANPAYGYADRLGFEMSVNGKTTKMRVGRRDQFAPQLLYFSECIAKNRAPEPSGEEGLQDVRIVEALYKSAATGRAVAVPPFTPPERPSTRQRISRPPVRKPELVKVKSPSSD